MKITNLNQFEALVDHMERNVAFARSFNKGLAKVDVKKEWNSLATKLNSLVPPIRDGDGWQKVWIDLKGKVKKKIAHNKRESHATRGGLFNQKSLSALEVVVANILCFNDAMNSPGVVLGISSPVAEKTAELSPCPEPASSTSAQALHICAAGEASENGNETVATNGKAKKRPAKDQAELLVEQIDIQRNLYTEVRQSLKNIENHLKDSERYDRKRFKLEEENLKLAREKFEWKKRRQAEKNAY